MPLAWKRATVFCTRALQLALHHRLGGVDVDEGRERLGDLAHVLLAAWLSFSSLIRSRCDARHSSTVSSSPKFSPTHSSLSSGRSISSTDLTVTVKSAGSSVPFGVDVNSSTSPELAPTSWSSKSSVIQPWPISYDQSSVLRPATSSPSRCRDEIERHEVADRSRAFDRRGHSRGGGARRRSPHRCRRRWHAARGVRHGARRNRAPRLRDAPRRWRRTRRDLPRFRR